MPDRSAHASLRGYLYQVCLGVQRWLDLADEEILVCEGDEDLDRRILGGGAVFEQVKDYRGQRLGLGDAAVVKGLRYFLRGYVELRRQGQPGRYVFTTTAEPSRRRDGLDFDLLQKWRAGKSTKKTCKEVRKLLTGKGAPEWVAEPAAWLDGEADRWKGFLDAVEWTFEAPDLNAVRRRIGEQIARHPALRLLPREDILERLVGEVLQRSSRKEQADRVLTRTDLDSLADSARAELADWVQTQGAPMRRLFEEIRDLDHLLTPGTLALREAPGPGELLTAAHEVIPFREAGRDKELARLAEWCNGEARRDVLLLTGEGGAGKTRLAIEWCRRLRHQGWHAGFLRRDRKGNDLDALVAGAAPRLIVIDYAETHLGVLTDLLYKMALNCETGPKVRLLLLSRRAGDWWTALREGREWPEIRPLLGSSQTQEIEPLVSGEEERRSAFRAAAEGFALARGGKLPEHLPEPPFEHPDFARALYLHMAALAALEGKTIGSAAEALTETLDHERRFWLRQVEEIKLDADVALWMKRSLRHAVAALTLIGGADPERAQALFGRVLTPSAGRTELRDLVADGLRRLYGRMGNEGLGLEPLRPDLLGEELIAAELERTPALLDRVLDGATAEEAQKALTVLTRLAQRRPGQGKTWLAAAFRGERLEQLAELALEVGIETGDPVGVVLAREIEQRANGELVRRLMDRCDLSRYSESVPLFEVVLVSTQRCFSRLPPMGSSPLDEVALQERARIAHNLGLRLSRSGRLEEALSAAKEAVEICRTLLITRAGIFLPDLANSLNSLGTALIDLGRRKEALGVMEEAVAHYRVLSNGRPGVFLPNLAMGLHNLGKILSYLGQPEKALSATEEAVEHYRSLSCEQSDTFKPDLAMSLTKLGNRLSELGRHEEALIAAEEAVKHYRALSGTRSDTFLPYLAASLSNLGLRLNTLGHREEALERTQEAVDYYRFLSRMRPNAFLSELATSLNNLGMMLSAVVRYEDALAVTEEAIKYQRALSTANPDSFLSHLATSLNNLGNRLSNLGRYEEALSAAEEAVALRRLLSAKHPGAFLFDLATSLNNLGNRLRALGRHEGALAATEEAVRYRRTLAAARPDAFLPDLAACLNNLGNWLSDLGQREEALAAADEAVRTLAPYFFRYPAAFGEWMTMFIRNYLRHSEAAGREPDFELLAPLLEPLGLSLNPPASPPPESPES